MRGLRWVLGGLTVLAGLLCLDFGASAEDQSGIEKLEARIIQGPSVGELIAYAYRSSPSIQMAREDWSAIVQRYRVTTAYPDPQVMISYFPEPIETRLGPQDWNVTVTQMVPFPGKLSKAGEIVDAEARIARLDLDRAVREVIVKIRESYHELLYIQEAKKVVAQNRDLLENLRKVAESSYAQDRAAFVDVVKAQSQSAQLQYDAILLEDLEETEKSRLNSLMNRTPDAQIGTLTAEPPLPLIYDLKEIYGIAEKYQEEIQMAEAMIDKATAGLALARYENLPDFKFGLFYAGIGEPDVPLRPPDAGHDAVGVQFGLSIPLWSGKNEGRVAEARAKEQRARAMKESRINESFAQIRNLYFRLMNSQRLVKLYRDQLLPQAAESIEIAETWFREKQGSFSDFVETESVYYNFQLSLARAKADYGKYLAQLERLVGRSLTKREDQTGAKVPQEGSP